ncbi:MAG: hypothetical protein GXO47_02350 [Chlorobi bacterium]|nr:hypothetical protein [Chlorobiota bacterium]
MKITIKPVVSRSDLKTFIHLPEKIHKNHKTWLPPIYKDEWDFFNPKKNKSFTHSDTVLLLAFKDNEAVGRIMGIINNLYNEIHNEKNGRFFSMECYDDQEVAHLLITEVEKWARDKGMEKLIGPLGFSDKDPQGFLISGFDYQTNIAMAGNHKYMPELIEKEGYTKKVDLHDYLIPVPDDLPSLYKRAYDRIKKRSDFRYEVLEFKTKKDLKKYIVPVFELMNEVYAPIYGFVPLSEKEMHALASQYLPVLDPEFVKAVLVNNELAAFVIAIPDISEGIKKSKGYLFPFGFYHIFRSWKKSKGIVLLLGGIKPEFRKNGMDVLMGVKMIESAIKRGKSTIESHLILETNTTMLGEMKKVGGKLIKKFRIFQKDLI